jgi:hypothetical protein
VAPSAPEPEAIRLYGEIAHQPRLEWAWVEAQLLAAGTYWIVAPSASHPHPRPVWGIWADAALVLSIGSLVVAASAAANPECTVHLDSGTDVVVVEGIARRMSEPDAALIAAYDRKYDWQYSYDEYGPFTRITPTIVRAWRSAGWAGRDGFQAVGRWRFA